MGGDMSSCSAVTFFQICRPQRFLFSVIEKFRETPWSGSSQGSLGWRCSGTYMAGRLLALRMRSADMKSNRRPARCWRCQCIHTAAAELMPWPLSSSHRRGAAKPISWSFDCSGLSSISIASTEKSIWFPYHSDGMVVETRVFMSRSGGCWARDVITMNKYRCLRFPPSYEIVALIVQ